jgi:type I restriction enzyme S subunit
MTANANAPTPEPTPPERRLVPRLRFPEFRDAGEWEVVPLAETAKFVRDRAPVSQRTRSDYVSTENLLPDFGGFTPPSSFPEDGTVVQYRANDILVSNIRPYLKKIWLADRPGGASNDVIVIRAYPAVNHMYLSYVLKNDRFIGYVMDGAKGLKMPRGDVSLMRAYAIPSPSLPEQRRIASCLSSLDEVIGAESRKLDALKLHKQGLMQQLFPREGETVPRLRFPEFRDAGEWERRTVADVLTKATNSVTVQPDATYREIGVRSHGKGIFHKDPVCGAALGDKRVFRVVAGALVLNIVFAWEQAVATTSTHEGDMIASHRFPMYIPRPNACDVRFVKLILLTPEGKRLLGVASPGGAGRNRTLGQSEFERLPLLLPDSTEQTSIADCVVALDDLITAQSDRLEALKLHKQGLMQLLFPAPAEAEG